MKTSNKILALMIAGILIATGAGLSFTSEALFNTGETWYSSTEMSDTGVQHMEFFNQGTTEFTETGNADPSSINKTMSADFSGFTIFSELNVVDGVGGEQTLSVSNHSMSVDKNVSMTPNSLTASEDVYLESEGEQSFRSEFVWWTDATMQKERTTTLLDLHQTQSTYNKGSGYYSTILLSPLPIDVSSSTSIFSE